MKAAARAARKVLERFRRARILTLAELVVLLGCSVRTAHRRLRTWGALNSYNCNGRFYTVPQVVQFDADGLWRCRGAFFSRHGSLTGTVVALVGSSPAGLTAAELGRKLGVNAHSFISRFAAHPLLARERIGGRHVYFSSDPGVRCRQAQSRSQILAAPGAALPSDAEAVQVFAEMIRHPKLEPDETSRRLATRGVRVDTARIQRLLDRHGLAKGGAARPESCLP
jgi:hypothetical protein